MSLLALAALLVSQAVSPLALAALLVSQAVSPLLVFLAIAPLASEVAQLSEALLVVLAVVKTHLSVLKAALSHSHFVVRAPAVSEAVCSVVVPSGH